MKVGEDHDGVQHLDLSAQNPPAYGARNGERVDVKTGESRLRPAVTQPSDRGVL